MPPQLRLAVILVPALIVGVAVATLVTPLPTRL